MICSPNSAADACRGIQYTFANYTVALAIAGGLAQLMASRIDLRSRPGIEDVDYKLGELAFQSSQRKNQRAADRRQYELLAGAWFGLSIALVISAVMSSLTINFPWFYGGGVAALFAPLFIASIPFLHYYCSQRPRLRWLNGIFGDDLAANIILEYNALAAVDELLTLSHKRFRDLKDTVATKRQERQEQIDQRAEERARSKAVQHSGDNVPPPEPPAAVSPTT